MDYTKNYHLPQWEKEDRIMMEDFNQMCADVEEGLSAGWTGLLRAAYNYYQLAAAAKGVPAQNGMFVQKLEGNTAPGNASNIMAWRDYGWIARAESSMNGETLKPYFTIDQELVMVKDDLSACVPMSATFAPPCPGQITRVVIRGDYNGCDTKAATFRIRFTNLDTGECEADVVCGARLLSGKIGVGEPVLDEVDLRFHSGVTYRLEVIPEDATVNGTFVLGYNKASSYAMTAAGNITQVLQDPDGGAAGIALVRYGTYGKGGTVSLSWDGAFMLPYRSRTFTDSKGRSVTELEFRRGGGVPKNSTLQLTASCPAGGELCIYDWGAILI